jgi:hypothetical protein
VEITPAREDKMLTSRLAEDQPPPHCTCYRIPHAFYCAVETSGELVPGWSESADAEADAADQARADKANR